MRLECNVCKLITHADTQELADAFRLEHSHKVEGVDNLRGVTVNGEPMGKYVNNLLAAGDLELRRQSMQLYDDMAKNGLVKPRMEPTDSTPSSDEFGEIFKEEKPIMSLVQQLDAQDEKDRTEFLNKVAPKRMNAGYRHKRDQFEKHLLTQTVYRFQDNVTVLAFLNFVDITLKAFDDAHTKSGVGPYDSDR